MFTPELYDIAIHIDNIKRVSEINRVLSDFLNCSEEESLKLLFADPSIVLRGVTVSIAETLKNKIKAEVILSNPITALYTLQINGGWDTFTEKIIQVINELTFPVIIKKQKIIENIDFNTTQIIWNRFKQTGRINIINQDFQRFQILLHEFDIENKKHKECLFKVVGIPYNFLYVLSDKLPVVLDESVDRIRLLNKIETYNKAGLKCSFQPLLFQNYKIVLHNIINYDTTKGIIKHYFPRWKGVAVKKSWKSPKINSYLRTRYIAQQLKEAGCSVETIRVE